MSRYRPSALGRWLTAAGVAAAYVVIATGLFWLDLGDAGVAPIWAILAVPPFYAVLSLFMLRRVSPKRRLSWTGGACLTHVLLGLAAAVVFSIVVDVTPMSAVAHAFARLGPVPVLALIATPLALAPFRGRVLAPRPTSRSARARRPSVMPPPPSVETPFAREARRRDIQAEATVPAPPTAPVPAAPAAPSAPTTPTVTWTPAPPPPVWTHPASPSPVVESPAVPDDVTDDAVVRVRFERVANQLPQDAFTLPLDRISESLREPHWLTVPRRIVLALLPEGAVQVDWAVVASQFPPLVYAGSDVEFRRKYPGLKLTLPLDDVLRQVPPGTFSLGPTSNHIDGLDAFPPPFQPIEVPRDLPDASAATPSAAPAQAAPVAAPPAAAPPPRTTTRKPAAASPSVAAPTPPPAPVAAPPPPPPPPPVAAPPPPPPPPPVAAPPPPPPPPPPVAAPPPPPPVAAPPPPPRPAPAAAPPSVAASRRAPAASRDAAPEIISRDALTRIAACLAGAGTFESWTGIVDGTPLVAFIAPTVPRDAVTAVAARVAGLLGAAAGEQVTVRTARAAIVVSAAPTAIVVAARRPGAPVALLELRAARAAGLSGRAREGGGVPPRALSSLAVDARVAGVAGTLGAFGVVEPAVLTDAGGSARVYVFREPGREAEHLGELALAVWEGLGRAREGDLGALASVVFRQGRRRILVRSIDGRGTTLLAAAGPVAQPGRAWREVDRAAAVLEMR
jgi:hypothetical protein